MRYNDFDWIQHQHLSDEFLHHYIAENRAYISTKIYPEPTECERDRMFVSRKMHDSSQWQVFLLLYVIGLMLSVGYSYDPCPESLRRSATPCKIPDSDIEKAFQEAEKKVEARMAHEKNLAAEGRTVNKKIKSPSSTHQQAHAPPRVREMEHRQLVLHEASLILGKQYKLTTKEKCCDLARMPLRTPSAVRAVQSCASGETIQCDSSAKYRTQDGTCNNLANPTWGSAFACFNRLLAALYTGDDAFRESVLGGPLPEPRNLSQNVHYNYYCPTNYINHLYMFFGQLLDHDITLTAASMTENNSAIECCPPRTDNHPQCAEINIPRNDSFYGRYNITCLNFVRSAICPYCTTGPRAQIMSVTAYIDASFVYGNSDNETRDLRTNNGTGRLRVQQSAYGDLLPRSDNPQNDQCSIPSQNQVCFQAGDQRANQHPALTSLHTVFLREHNRIAVRLRALNPQWNDERLFQEARKIVGAEMQCITYNEYLWITLGDERMRYFSLYLSQSGRRTTYNSSIDPTILTEFSTAAFRFGHSLVNSWVQEDRSLPNHSGHNLRDVFFYPFGLYEGEVDIVLNGSVRSPSQFFDRHMVQDVTNFLYRIRGNATGFDLASFNIQRGRDHGLERYVECVRFCSEDQIIIQSFRDLQSSGLMTYENVCILEKNYRDVRDIDLFTGILSERYNQGAVIGPTGTCFVGIQFYRLKFGDRFYFEHGGQQNSFTTTQVDELRKTLLSRILCDNTDITAIQGNAMLYPDSSRNPVVSCNALPQIDLQAWKE